MDLELSRHRIAVENEAMKVIENAFNKYVEDRVSQIKNRHNKVFRFDSDKLDKIFNKTEAK